jgi:hypothetical protein
MSEFNVFAIPDSVVAKIRKERLDDFGHQLTLSKATEEDTGPCRSCLKVFKPGEARLLFSYAPNPCDHPYNEIGPVYIHENSCSPYSTNQIFPPELRTRRPISLRCYAENGVMVNGELVGERPIEVVIKDLFKDPVVKYLHARTATVGCYIARIERAPTV